MNINIDPIAGFYIVGAVAILILFLMALPSVMDRSRKSVSKR